jgi:hypothetical protein
MRTTPLPKIKTFAEKEAGRARKAADKARAEQLKALPPDVRAAVEQMSVEDQISYLQSLDKVADMAAKGETWTPGTPAPYGVTKDGKVRQKPGPKPQPPGARTKERPEPFVRDLDLEAIIGNFDDDEPVVLYGYRGDDDGDDDGTSGSPPVTAAELEAAERAEQQAYVDAALARLGINSSNVVVGPVAAVQLKPVGDPTDLVNYRVDRLDCELRLLDTGRGYRLEFRYLPPPEAGSDGAWETIGDTYHPDGSAASMARMDIRPVDWDAFGLALAAVPSPHPAVADKLDRGPRGAGEGAPKTDDERRRWNEDIKRQMIEQRQRNALHRGVYEGDRTGEGYSWI